MDKAVRVVLKCIVTAAMVATLAGCATFGGGLPCTVGPVIGDKGASDRWTRSEKEQIVALNETGARLCGWKP